MESHSYPNDHKSDFRVFWGDTEFHNYAFNETYVNMKHTVKVPWS